MAMYLPLIFFSSLFSLTKGQVACDLWVMVPVSSVCGLVMGIVVVIFGFFCSNMMQGQKNKRGVRRAGQLNSLVTSAPGSAVYRSSGSEAVDKKQMKDAEDEKEEPGSRVTYMTLLKTRDAYTRLHNQPTPTENIKHV